MSTIETSSRVIELSERFGIEQLRLTRRALPELQRGEVLVRLRACSLNYRDLMMVEGRYNPRQPLPLIPCSDGAGEVVAVGEGVAFKVGERVAPIFAQDWEAGEPAQVTQSTLGGPLDGTLRTHAIFPARSLVALPSYLSNIEASTLGCAALTAWSALVELGRLTAGQRVLCIGTGGVSLFAAQIAKALGAEVFLSSGSEDKLERAAEHVKPHHSLYTPRDAPQRWGRELRKRSGGGLDHVIEVGGRETLAQSLEATRPGGTVSLIGVLSGSDAPPALSLLPILMRQIRVQGVIVGHREGFERMLKAFELHQLRPLISHQFELAQSQEAFRTMAEARHIGKITIDLSAEA